MAKQKTKTKTTTAKTRERKGFATTARFRPGRRADPFEARHVVRATPIDVKERQLPVGDRDEPATLPGEGTEPRSLEDLGPILMPSAEDAHRVLRELAQLYHERFTAQLRHDDLKAQTKSASDDVAAITKRIVERIRVSTHRTGLPLFTEADHTSDAFA